MQVFIVCTSKLSDNVSVLTTITQSSPLTTGIDVGKIWSMFLIVKILLI